MNITRRLLPTSLAILLSACAVVVHAADLEVAPLFAGYELGCGISGAAQGLVVWANPDQKGRLASVDTLPTVWRSHIGKPIVTDEIDHWYVQVPLRQVLFRGLRLTRLERWYGKNNGISGWRLVLDAPLQRRGVVSTKIDLSWMRTETSSPSSPRTTTVGKPASSATSPCSRLLEREGTNKQASGY